MSKRNLSWNEKKLEKFLKEGRGKGVGKEYKPWTIIQDYPSEGRVSRIAGWKTGRVHHLQSDLEKKYFYLLEWFDEVIDIREKYPLLDTIEFTQIYDEMEIEYPVDKESKTPYILTTDFLITVKVDGREILIARDVEPSGNLERKSVIEKFEAKRRYWARKKVDWGIVTEKDIPEMMVKNIEWVHSSLNLENHGDLDLPEAESVLQILKNELRNSDNSIRDITQYIDKEMNLALGTSLYLFKHLIARKEIILDMQEKINLNDSANVVCRFVDRKSKENVV